SNTRLSERIKKYKLMKIPVIIIIGDNDISNKTLAINFSDGRNEQDIKINAGLSSINKYLKEPLLKIK
ncbi:MAG: His/Gly/Thr/Pro-type tRNA ligase C-terminal domain-containing protein, partial [Actinomycetota bacterium]|nr:His/Gly/Thr/Pro-type tRNA ligase C-terminal domain-containing protein [Actinomycetota bacterium]